MDAMQEIIIFYGKPCVEEIVESLKTNTKKYRDFSAIEKHIIDIVPSENLNLLVSGKKRKLDSLCPDRVDFRTDFYIYQIDDKYILADDGTKNKYRFYEIESCRWSLEDYYQPEKVELSCFWEFLGFCNSKQATSGDVFFYYKNEEGYIKPYKYALYKIGEPA